MKDKLNESQKANWLEVVNLFKLNAEGTFSRMCATNPEGRHSLHVFTDASNIGYGCVAYVTTIENNPTSSFLCAKSKLKGSTVKRLHLNLELSGILFSEIIDRLVIILSKIFKKIVAF